MKMVMTKAVMLKSPGFDSTDKNIFLFSPLIV